MFDWLMDVIFEVFFKVVGKVFGVCGLVLVIVEFCIGGWVVELVIDIVGSLGWFDCGFIIYFN